MAVGCARAKGCAHTSLYLTVFDDRGAAMRVAWRVAAERRKCPALGGLPARRSGLQARHLLHSDGEAGKPDQNLSQRRSTHTKVF